MLEIRCWNDLQKFGIVPLTGESCGLMYRILFDCTEQGRTIIGRCLSLPRLTLEKPWNRGGANDPHVGSVMLAPEMRIPLAIFALLHAGCVEVWLLDDGSVVGFKCEEYDELHRKQLAPRRIRAFAAKGTAGDRNVHTMTGRIT